MRKRFKVGVAVALVVALGACGGRPAAAPKADPKPKPSEEPKVKVLWTLFDDENVDFVAEISNPADRTRTGVETTWKAFDSDGVIVASFNSKRPPIPPNDSILYVGHSGDTSGVAESVKVTLSKRGALTKNAPKPAVRVGEPTFTRADYDVYEGVHTYDVSVILTALSDVAGADVTVNAVLRDDSGEIVGAGYGGGPGVPGFGQDLPKTISKGEKVRLEFDAKVPEGSTPTKVEAFAGA